MKKTAKTAHSFNKWVEKNSRIIFAIVTLVLAGIMIYFFIANQPPDFYLSAKISHLPSDAEHILIITADVMLPMTPQERLELSEFMAGDFKPTLFIGFREASSDAESDIELLKSYDADYAILSNEDFSSMPYQDQEDFLWTHKDLLSNLNVNGFRTEKLTYDTLLAVENAQLDYFSGFTEIKEPEHPDSLLGGKMRMIFYPLAGQELSLHQEVWTLRVPPSSESLTALEPLIQNDSILKWTMSQTTEWIKTKEQMGVEVSTDLRKLVSTIKLTKLQKNTTLVLTSNLKVLNVSSGNTTYPYYYRSGSLHIPTPDARLFQVWWVEP